MAQNIEDVAHLVRERDTAKFRANAQQMKAQLAEEVAAMKSDAQRFGIEVARLKGELAEKVAEAKATIGDHALDRMSKALSEFRNIALATVAVLTALGALSYFQLESQVSKTVIAKLDDWLALDKPGSLARMSLETVRARAELDAFVVKLQRADLTGHDDPLQLSEADKDRLVGYLMNSSTNLSDFRDGVVVLAASLGRFNLYPDRAIDKLVDATFTTKQPDEERAWILIATLNHYRTMARYASAQLNAPVAEKWPDAVRASVLACWSGADMDGATAFARAHIADEKSPQIGAQEARLLAQNPGDQALVDEWLNAHARTDIAAYVEMVDAIAPLLSTSIDYLPNQRQQRLWLRQRATSLLVQTLKMGASLVASDALSDGQQLGFQLGNTTRYVTYPGAIFMRDNTFAKDLADAAAKAALPPEQFVNGMTTRSDRGEIFGLQIDTTGLVLTGETFGPINATTVAGSVMLVSLGGPHPVQASFRAKDGRWVTDRVTAFPRFYGVGIQFSYDQAFIQRADMRRIRRVTWSG